MRRKIIHFRAAVQPGRIDEIIGQALEETFMMRMLKGRDHGRQNQAPIGRNQIGMGQARGREILHDQVEWDEQALHGIIRVDRNRISKNLPWAGAAGEGIGGQGRRAPAVGHHAGRNRSPN